MCLAWVRRTRMGVRTTHMVSYDSTTLFVLGGVTHASIGTHIWPLNPFLLRAHFEHTVRSRHVVRRFATNTHLVPRAHPSFPSHWRGSQRLCREIDVPRVRRDSYVRARSHALLDRGAAQPHGVVSESASSSPESGSPHVSSSLAPNRRRRHRQACHCRNRQAHMGHAWDEGNAGCFGARRMSSSCPNSSRTRPRGEVGSVRG